MSNALDSVALMALVRRPWAVALSVVIKTPLGDWGWPISSKAVICGTASFAPRYIPPVSASAAEETTFGMVLQRTWTVPFMRGLSVGDVRLLLR